MNMKKFTSIEGMFNEHELVRLGMIRLGYKKEGISKKTGKKIEFPVETDYFVCPKEVQKALGEDKPKEMEIQIASADRSLTIPYSYTFYGSGIGVKCKGNGKIANEKQKDGTWKEIKCPCKKLEEKGGCKLRGYFQFIIPSVNLAACYQISTTSYRSVKEILNGLNQIENFFRKPCDQISLYTKTDKEGKTTYHSPIIMQRTKGETHHNDEKQTHYPVQIFARVDPEYINNIIECNQKVLISLPAPKEKNPEFDPVDMIESQGIKDEEDIPEAKVVEPEVIEKETKEEPKVDQAPAQEKPKQPKSEKTKKEQKLHIMAEKLGLDAHKELNVKSLKDLSLGQIEEAIEDFANRINEMLDNKQPKTSPVEEKETKKGKATSEPEKPSDSSKFDIPQTINDCWLAINSLIKSLGLKRQDEAKIIIKKYGPNLDLKKLQEACKDYQKKVLGE